MRNGWQSPPLTNHQTLGSRRRLLTSTATPRHSTTTNGAANEHTNTANTGAKTNMASSFTNTQTHYGLLIALDKDNRLCLQFCPDRNLREIHPNSYAPAALTNVHKLGGGGSGVAVFCGHHEELGNVVMKHGSDKDLTELFALCEVAHELKERSASHADAARHIGQRIPSMKMIYISPHHLGEKRKALWNRLRDISRINDTIMLLPIDEMVVDDDSGRMKDESTISSHPQPPRSPTSWRSYQDPSLHASQNSDQNNPQFADDDEDEIIEAEESFRMLKNCAILEQYNMARDSKPDNLPPGVEISKSGTFSGHREIAIATAPYNMVRPVEVKLKGESLLFVLPEGQFDCDANEDETSHTRKIRLQGDGYQLLQRIYQDLLALMKGHKWKFTLGQKLIGGTNPRTGNEWLYANQLRGPVLTNLVTQKINLVRDLVSLTTPDEQDATVLQDIRDQVQCITTNTKTAKSFNAADLSPEADAFVGNAIRKNFRSETGRLPMLMLLGKHFRDFDKEQANIHHPFHHQQKGPHLPRHDSLSHLVLTPEEKIPAHHLGVITNPGAFMGNTFERAPMEPTVLESMGPKYWQTLLQTAVASDNTTNKTTTPTTHMMWTRLWTCGLADAGLHNLFCSEDRLWLFDLGEPQLTSVPGFLTKFLFSFFHTLGMQEPEADSTTWVRRFEHNKRTRKLQLTSATSKLLKQAYAAFAMALDRIVQELFHRDDSVRWLLLQYVTLQLVSDASFCLQKWTIKGGGRTRDSNHQEGLEKWLWRALWDIYVACDINSTSSLKSFKVQPTQAQDIKIVSSTLRERQMALIQELALETTRLDSNPHQSNQFHKRTKGFLPFVNA